MKNKKVILVVAAATLFALASCTKSTKNVSSQSSVSSDNVISDSKATLSEEISLDPVMTGSGTEADPYIISNSAQLVTFASSDKAAYYKLGSDIDFKGKEWNAVGNDENPFTGNFDGNGYTISNLKIASYQADNTLYGFFGYAEGAKIKNVKFNNTVIDDFVVSGADTTVFIGGIAAKAINTSISNVQMNYSKYNVVTKQTGSSYIYAGGIGGYLATEADDTYMYYVSLDTSSVSGNITLKAANDDVSSTSSVGGLAGVVYTYSGEGIYAITNTSFNGNIDGGTYDGGITGYLDVYASVSDSFVKGEYVKSDAKDGGYAGGIAGFATYDTAIVNCAADLKTVSAELSSSSVYKSYAGPIAGFYKTTEYYVNVYAEYMDGCGIYNSYAKTGISVTGDNVQTGKTADLGKDFYKNTLNLSDTIWDLTGETPSIKANAESGKVTVTFDLNYEGANKGETYEINAGMYNTNLVQAALNSSYTRSGYNYNGLYYDKEGSVSYRWYVPVNVNTTIYAKWADVSAFAGTYLYTLTYGEYTHNGTWKFEDENFTWLGEDGSVMKYTYLYDEDLSVVSIQEYVGLETAPSGAYGGYEGRIFTVNADGSITAIDANDEETEYNAVKQTIDVEIPDYTDLSVLGTWYASNGTVFSLYKDANCAGNTPSTSKVMYYGGYRFNDNKLVISIFGKISASNDNPLIYDEENNIFCNSSYFVSSSEITSTYEADDGLKLYLTKDGGTYAIKDGKLYANSVSGELKDEEQITIGDNVYIVSGTNLKNVSTDEPEDTGDEEETNSDSSSTEKTYVGTWNGTSGINSITIEINDDGTINYGGLDGTYTVTDNVISATLSDETILTLTYDSEKQTLTGKWEEETEGYEYAVNCSGYTPKANNTSSSIAGTYTGTWGYYSQNACTIVLNEEGTGSLSNEYGVCITFNYALQEDGTLTITNEDDVNPVFGDLTLKYDAEKNKLTGTAVEDYEYEYTISVTK